MDQSKPDSNQFVSNPLQKVVSIQYEAVWSGFAPRVMWFTRYLYFCTTINQLMHTYAHRDSTRKNSWLDERTNQGFCERMGPRKCLESTWQRDTKLNDLQKNHHFRGTVRTVLVHAVMRYWRNGHVTKMTLHLWVCISVNARKRIEPVQLRIDANWFECAFNPVCSVNGPLGIEQVQNGCMYIIGAAPWKTK